MVPERFLNMRTQRAVAPGPMGGHRPKKISGEAPSLVAGAHQGKGPYHARAFRSILDNRQPDCNYGRDSSILARAEAAMSSSAMRRSISLITRFENGPRCRYSAINITM